MSLLPGRLFAGSQYRQFLLAMLISIPAAWLPALFVRFVAPGLEQRGPLPALTQAWLHWYPWAWCLPALVLLTWLLKLGSPRSGTLALALAYAGALLINAVAVIAVWVSVLALPGNL